MDNLTLAVPGRIAQLAAGFSQTEPIRRGSLYERRMKCGQVACACQDDPKAAHGPYFTLTQKVRGKTRSRYIPPEQAPLVRRQIESGRQFRERVEVYWDACERSADEQLEAVPASAEEAEKKASGKPRKRNHPGNRDPHRTHGAGRLRFRSDRDGGVTAGFALGSARAGQRLNADTLTPGVLRMAGSAAALLSFEESSGLLRELAGVEVGPKQVERAAEALGAEIAVDERQHVAQIGEAAPTMYLGMDGTGVPMRSEEIADRAGKPADGSAKTREAKLVTVWTAESRDEEGKAVRDPGSITYSAAIESASAPETSPNLSEFAARVLREATRRGFTEAARPAVLGDGSPWICNTAAELFPQATQILDRFHAKEHLSKVAKVVYGGSLEGKPWMLRYDATRRLALRTLLPAAGERALR